MVKLCALLPRSHKGKIRPTAASEYLLSYTVIYNNIPSYTVVYKGIALIHPKGALKAQMQEQRRRQFVKSSAAFPLPANGFGSF